VKVGDIVKWWSGQENADRNPLEPPAQYGIVIAFNSVEPQLALVLFEDAELAWMTSTALEVINESR